MLEYKQTVGQRLALRTLEIMAHAQKLAPSDGSPFDPPVIDRIAVRRELNAAARQFGFTDQTAQLRSPKRRFSLDLAADTAEEKLYKESFGPDAHPGQRMTSSNPWETCVCGPAHFSDGRLLGEALHAARMEKKDAKTPSGK